MPNYRFDNLIRQVFSRHYKIEIISRIISEGYIPDNEEDQIFYKVNVMGWIRMLSVFVFF